MRGCGGRLGGLLSSVKCSCREGSEVCEGVGKQKGCDEIETVDVSLALQPLSVCGGDSCNSAFMTHISPRRTCREVSLFSIGRLSSSRLNFWLQMLNVYVFSFVTTCANYN